MQIIDLFESDYPDDSDNDHRKALERTGYWGKQGAGGLFLAANTKRFLIGRRSRFVEQPGTYGTWGGAIDNGENPINAVEREMKEEAGYNGTSEIKPMFVFTSGSFQYSNFLIIVPEEFTPILNWEHQGYKWCQFGQWPQPLHFGMKALLADPASVRLMQDYFKS